jgi:dephospho-CoA kinase
MLIYVTGTSGSGKSAVLRELEQRGFEAHGVDEEGYADWINIETGERETYEEDDPKLDLHDWYKNHHWVLSKERIEALKYEADALQRPVFLTGSAAGDGEVWHLFDKVIVLSVDAATIKHRIETRQDNQYGKAPEEMKIILDELEGYDDTYRGFGAVIVDATRPLEQVVDEIVSVSS